MRRPLTISGSFILILTAIACTMGALISAFSFSVETRILYIAWTSAAIALSVLAVLLRSKGILILLLPALILLLWKAPEVLDGAKWVIFRITSEYNRWLYVPVFFPGAIASSYDVTLFFAAAGIVLAFLLSSSICVLRNAFLTISFTIPFVFLTIVLIETASDVRYLVGLFAVYFTLIISSSLHPYDFMKRGASILPALALSIILLAAAYLAAPPGSYKRSGFINNIDSYLRNTAERIGMEINKKGIGWPENFSGEWRFNTDYVNISDAGTRTITNRSILEITATQPGTFYLKGFSMQSFNGREWHLNPSARPSSDESLSDWMPMLIAELYTLNYPDKAQLSASMTIARTGDRSDIVYWPYYSLPVSQAASYPYTVDFYYVKDSILGLHDTLSSDGITVAISGSSMRMWAPSVYTQIDDSTARGLRRLAIEAGIDPYADRSEIADKVAEYISSSARYTLSPYVIPDNEDFALYFLRTAKRGYCIHFATAATLMLRALDIPARFTSGFVVTVSDDDVGGTVVVTDRNAHAWVEVYYDDVGWIPLEVTPSQPGAGIPSILAHTAGQASEDPFASDDNGNSSQPDDGSSDDDLDEGRAPTATRTPGAEEQADASPDDAGQGEEAARSGVLLVIICVAACVLATIARRIILRRFRERRFDQQDTNAAVLFAWRYVSRLSRRNKPPEKMEELALKARFSLHRITDEERTAMINDALKYSMEVYDQLNPPGRLWFRYILGF